MPWLSWFLVSKFHYGLPSQGLWIWVLQSLVAASVHALIAASLHSASRILFSLTWDGSIAVDAPSLHLRPLVAKSSLYLALSCPVTLRWEILKAGWPIRWDQRRPNSQGQIPCQPSWQTRSCLSLYHCFWSRIAIADRLAALRLATHFAHREPLQSHLLLRHYCHWCEHWNYRCYQELAEFLRAKSVDCLNDAITERRMESFRDYSASYFLIYFIWSFIYII